MSLGKEGTLDDMLVQCRPGVIGKTLLDCDVHVIRHVLHEAVDVPVNIPRHFDLTIKRIERRSEADGGEIVGDVGERDPELAPVDLILDDD